MAANHPAQHWLLSSVDQNSPDDQKIFAIPTAPKTNATIDGIEPPTPLDHILSFTRNGIINRCGKGNHTVPSWARPGNCESKTRRAILMCATASPYSRILS